ncbi:LOW QUALITY PROTEIN: serine/threonine protein kinase OSK1-like [Puntigrus tetrazona]|uniref:LOW QUALITY PROTEIN: serine/threonine protein kinase OSK1-like n=1 Tax=Puntigrus tetrazona TaxID=1606681 RepID=UPI001C8AB7B8|nr:LOW QUALITY PROTEIN: serine/threonine protein kinase OSK1-like [Puntigrus tetrazona]
MMYTMMCKCRPFRSPEDMMHGSLSFNVRVSTELQNLISRCLTVDPTKRATTEEILQHKWFQRGQMSGVTPNTIPFDEIYEVGDKLGQGSFGTVYEGTSKIQRKKVAIKIILKCKRDRYIELPGCSKPLFAEVAANLLLKQAPLSPYIVYMLEWFEEEDRFILILEHPEPCKDLLRFVVHNMHWPNELQTRSLMYQAVLGAKHCLDRGVFHRDIKLNNFLINTTTNRVQLIDFGCSDLVKSTGYLGGFIGGVCPPEYYKGLGYKAEPTTVWSLGVMMYTMMCKCLPFSSPEDMMHGSLSFNVRVSTELQNLISRCLTVDPTKRATIEEILQHKWFCKGNPNWIRIPVKNGGFDFCEFIKEDGDKAGKKLVNILVADMVEKYGRTVKKKLLQPEKGCDGEAVSISHDVDGGVAAPQVDMSVAELADLLRAHMARMDGWEAERQKEQVVQELRFKALQHQFGLLQMEVQAGTTPAPLQHGREVRVDTGWPEANPTDTDEVSRIHRSPDQAEGPVSLPLTQMPRLEKLGETDDVEHFLVTFERSL